MSEDQWVKLIEVLIWPATALILLLLLRNAVTGAIGRLKGVEGPAGWKLLFEVKKVRERLQNLEEMTTNIYNLSGKSAAVRDEIFDYVADILNNKVSPQTAREMRIELNKYHIPRLGVSAIKLKTMLNNINYYGGTETEKNGFNEEISSEFLDAMYKFQKDNNMRDADGIIGPKTLELLITEVKSHNKANTADS